MKKDPRLTYETRNHLLGLANEPHEKDRRGCDARHGTGHLECAGARYVAG
jgi:hypothetical protein